MSVYTTYFNYLSNEGEASSTFLTCYSNYYTVRKFIYHFNNVGTLYRELSSDFWQPLVTPVYRINESSSGWSSTSSHSYISTPYIEDLWYLTGLETTSTSWKWRNDDQGNALFHSYISADINILDNSRRIGINLSAIATPTINVIFDIDEGFINTQPNNHGYSIQDYGLESDPGNDEDPPDPPPVIDPPDPPPDPEPGEYSVYLMESSDDGLRLDDLPITEAGAISKGWSLDDGKVYVIF
ncbi:hypothetical protein KAR91_30095 [Candidatus Pacearchaeota archaeon]|nr:hypothetical protein [Candidatus Pacearchaeota archaeon]